MATHGVVGISRRGGAMRGLLKSGLVRYGKARVLWLGQAFFSWVRQVLGGHGGVRLGHQGFLTGGNYGSSFRIKEVNS